MAFFLVTHIAEHSLVWIFSVLYMFPFVVLFGHLGILFNGPPKPEAYRSFRSWALCEELILTMGAQHGWEPRIFLSWGKHSNRWAILPALSYLTDLLSLRLVGAVGARMNERSSYLEWAISMTRSWTQDLSIMSQAIELSSYMTIDLLLPS